MLTAFHQSCCIYFILSNLLFCKITHVFNFIFSFNFFINQVIKIFTTPSFFASEIQSNNRTVLFTFIIFMYFYYRNFSFIPCFSANINHFIHTQEKNKFFDDIKCSIILTVFHLIFVLSLWFFTTQSHNFIFFIFTS